MKYKVAFYYLDGVHKLNLYICYQRDGLDLNPCDACYWDFLEIGHAHFCGTHLVQLEPSTVITS